MNVLGFTAKRSSQRERLCELRRTWTRLALIGLSLMYQPLVGMAGAVAGTGPEGCFDPAQFGAIPNDGVDDRLAIQTAIDAAAASGRGRVCLGAGRWTLTRAPTGSYNRFAALSIHSPHIELQGAGPGTVLEIVGNQGLADLWVIALDPGARDISIRDLTIDTSSTFNNSEQ